MTIWGSWALHAASVKLTHNFSYFLPRPMKVFYLFIFFLMEKKTTVCLLARSCWAEYSAAFFFSSSNGQKIPWACYELYENPHTTKKKRWFTGSFKGWISFHSQGRPHFVFVSLIHKKAWAFLFRYSLLPHTLITHCDSCSWSLSCRLRFCRREK